MALIAMAVYSTEENGKDEYLADTLNSLVCTVDFLTEHRLMVSVNAATPQTIEILEAYETIIDKAIFNKTNLGTAEAINLIWKERNPGENCIKMDDDVIIHNEDWVYLMEEAIRRDPTIGQIGLKRRDCMESPFNPEPMYTSELIMLPHKPGEKWIVVEKVKHVMGTCQMYSSALLDRIGYLKQPYLYGFDDVIASFRSNMAGFKNVFLCGVDIEHIDPGTSPFQKWKEQHASESWAMYHKIIADYKSGKEPIYYNPFQ
jgi:GT2 family glycosyltransferase